MPNHCYNRVSFYSDNQNDIAKLHEIFETGTNPYVDKTVFGQIVPEPNWKNTPNDKGELPILREMKSPKTGEVFHRTYDFPDGTNDDRWYTWRVQNWGTKWDCYDLSIDEDDLPNGFEATFNTAWSPPEEVCYAIKEQFDDLSMSWFYDEPGCEVAGYL